ncbi:MAG TPA: UMP kinase [Candidatus Ozemobacteraceae bacterium]|nr:UMP kinase [Candidatus Ozemobacteraceae bacterium]
MSRTTPTFRRPLLKLSGEMLGGGSGFGFDRAAIEAYAAAVAELTKHGITPSLVIGGGNFFRGARGHLPALERHHADTIGMLATVMNAVCFADHLATAGVRAKVFSATAMAPLVETYTIDRVRECLDDGIVCLFGGGTGSPYFSTDSAAALRAIETGCDVLIKATKVDGVYDADPMKNPGAKKFDTIQYREVLDRQLGVMDLVAITLCRDNRMPLLVLSMAEPHALLRACTGETLGTRVVEA